MPTKAHKTLNDLKMNIVHMATLAEESVQKALRALIRRDTTEANEVVAGDEQLNDFELRIDEQCLELLALQQPMAVDLRLIMCSFRINGDLERIGDLAVNIAERAVELNNRPRMPFPVDVQPLADVALAMLQDSITAFLHGDTQLARQVCVRDDEADDLYREFVRHLMDEMVHHTPAIERSVSYIIIGRCFERIADLATNVAEAAVFHVEGKTIKHHSYE